MIVLIKKIERIYMNIHNKNYYAYYFAISYFTAGYI